jgi:hypothetical protein
MMNDYQKQALQAKIDLAKSLTDLSGRRWYVMAGTDSDYRQVKLTGDLPILANYATYQHTYNFFLDHHYPYIRYETMKKEVEKLGKPNEIHKLDGRRINQWVDHLTKLNTILKLISDERVGRINQFINEVKKAGGYASPIDPHYHTCNGSIYKNGIDFRFEVHDEGYISQKIEVSHMVRDTIADFEALADNKWVKPE